MNYGEVLANAGKIIWKYKVLWIFGILAAIGSAGGGGGGGGGNSSRTGAGQYLNPDFGGQVGTWMQQYWWIPIMLVLLALALVFFLAILGTYGRIGLARGAWQADDGVPRLTLGGLFAESGRYFLRVFLMALLLLGIAILAALAVGIPTAIITAVTFGIGLICLIPFFCVLAIVGWLIQIVVRLAIIAIVGEDLGTLAGLRRGWEVARAHLGEAIVMGLILGIGEGILRIVVGIPFIGVLLPMVYLFFNGSEGAVRNVMLAAGGLFCLYLPVAIFLGGVIESYVGTAWTLTFRRLSGRLPASAEVKS